MLAATFRDFLARYVCAPIPIAVIGGVHRRSMFLKMKAIGAQTSSSNAKVLFLSWTFAGCWFLFPLVAPNDNSAGVLFAACLTEVPAFFFSLITGSFQPFPYFGYHLGVTGAAHEGHPIGASSGLGVILIGQIPIECAFSRSSCFSLGKFSFIFFPNLVSS